MMPLSAYRNHSARARTVARALDITASPFFGSPGRPSSRRVGAAMPSPRRILVIRPDHVGDLLMATPAIRALRRAHPTARIELLASPWGAAAALGNPDIDRVRTVEATWFEPHKGEGPDPSRLIGSIAVLRDRPAASGGRYDAAADLRGDFRSILIALWTGAARRAGFSRIGLEALLTDSVPLDPSMDHVTRNHTIVQLLGAGPIERRRPVFVIPPEADDTAAALLAPLDERKPIVAIYPGTNRPWASWGADRFAETARLLSADGRVSIVADGRAADRSAAERVLQASAAGAGTRASAPSALNLAGRTLAEAPAALNLAGRKHLADAPAALNLAGRTSLAEAAAVIQRSSLLIANDSGAAHLAVAVGTPVIAIFGPTDPALFWTWEDPERNVALFGASSCTRPCFRTHCPGDHGYASVTPVDVASLALRLAGSGSRGRHS